MRPELSFHVAGVNYTGFANVDADMAYFKSIKSPNAPYDIRVMVAASATTLPIPWVVQTPDPTWNANKGNWEYHLRRAQKFAADPDFRVVFNMYAGPTTRAKLVSMRTSLVQAALHIQDMGIPMEISLGNELTGTYGILFAIISLTQTGGVATLVAASPFPTFVGDTITIFNSTRAQYNATHTVIDYDGNATIKFNIDPATVNPGNGSLHNVTVQELQTWFCDTAQAIKDAGWHSGAISVGDFNGSVHGVTPYEEWIARGKNNIGGLDLVSIHPYPAAKGNPAYIQSFPADAAALFTAFGNKSYASEFNLSGFSVSGFSDQTNINSMADMLTTMNSLGVTRAILWSWDTNLAAKNPDGSFHPIWGKIITQNGRYPFRLYNKTRPQISDRLQVSGRTQVTGRTRV